MSSIVTQTQSSSKIDKAKGKQKEAPSSAGLSLSSKVQHDNPTYNSNWIQQAVHSDFHQNIFSFEDFVKNEVKVKLDHGKYKDLTLHSAQLSPSIHFLILILIQPSLFFFLSLSLLLRLSNMSLLVINSILSFRSVLSKQTYQSFLFELQSFLSKG